MQNRHLPILGAADRPGALPGGLAAAWLLALALALTLLAAGCSPHREIYPKLEGLARAGDYQAAAQLVEKSKDLYGDRNAVLFNMDRGLFYHYAGKYKESNAAFQAAEAGIDELFSESITGNLAAFAVNDNTLPYKGEDFEGVVINIYRSLNYILLGEVDAALVEARKVNQKLDLINRQYDADQKNVYREDAFARMLMGVLYEMGGTRDDLNDAYISNQLAANIYQKEFTPHYGVAPPALLSRNLLATAGFMGAEEVAKVQKQFPGVEADSLEQRREQGQVYLIHFAGRAPSKVEDAIRAVMPDGNLIKVAFPRYKPNYYLITGSRVRVKGRPGATLETVEPIGGIAVENLANRKGRIAAKAIARATTKYLASRVLQKKAREQSEGAGLLAWAAGTVFAEASEQADLRAWQTLPDRVLLGRLLLPPGHHRLEVDYLTGAGAVVATRDLGEVELEAGRIRFIILHTLN